MCGVWVYHKLTSAVESKVELKLPSMLIVCNITMGEKLGTHIYLKLAAIM